ncbi:MAG: hypothetical protein ACTSYA_13415 [Candidatus Kariarchaeaceae archaeon]
MIPSNITKREKIANSLSLADIFFSNIVSACILYLNQSITYDELLLLVSSFSIDFEKIGLTKNEIWLILKPMGNFS